MATSRTTRGDTSLVRNQYVVRSRRWREPRPQSLGIPALSLQRRTWLTSSRRNHSRETVALNGRSSKELDQSPSNSCACFLITLFPNLHVPNNELSGSCHAKRRKLDSHTTSSSPSQWPRGGDRSRDDKRHRGTPDPCLWEISSASPKAPNQWGDERHRTNTPLPAVHVL